MNEGFKNLMILCAMDVMSEDVIYLTVGADGKIYGWYVKPHVKHDEHKQRDTWTYKIDWDKSHREVMGYEFLGNISIPEGINWKETLVELV